MSAAGGAGESGAEALGDGLALGWPPTPDPSDWRGRTLMARRPTPTTRTAAMAARTKMFTGVALRAGHQARRCRVVWISSRADSTARSDIRVGPSSSQARAV